MKKIALVLGLFSLSSSLMTANNWVKVPHQEKGVTIYYDFDTLKTKKTANGSRYLEAQIQRIYDVPKKTDKGTVYTHYYYTLSVDCNNWRYATSDTVWAVNGKRASDGSGNYSWRSIQADGRVESEAFAVCDL